MIRAPYDTRLKVDPVTTHIMQKLSVEINHKDDDTLLMCTGTAGTGKSSLMLHCYEAFDPENATVDTIGLSRTGHAKALAFAKDGSSNFCAFDEANINRRNAMTTENKDLIGLYYSIRGLKIFHWWNNPSAEMLDKPFIEERIKGLIYIATKSSDRPRIFYYFTKEGMLKLLEDKGNLKHRTLDKYAKQYAYYQGWFKKYDGELYKDYLKKKESHMTNYVDEYLEKYGDENTYYGKTELSRKKKCSLDTINKRIKELEEENNWVEHEDYILTPANRMKISESGAEKI